MAPASLGAMRGAVVLFACFVLPSLAQNLDSLKKSYAEMVSATEKLDFEKILDKSYPRMFEMASRKDIAAALKKTFEDPKMKLSIEVNNVPASYSKIIVIGAGRYCVVSRETILKLKFYESLNDDTAKTVRNNIALGNPLRKVEFRKPENTFYSTGPDIVIAVSDKETKGEWRFVNYEPAQRSMLASWFGNDTLAKLPLPATPQVEIAASTASSDWQRPEDLTVENGKVSWQEEEIPIFDSSETRSENFKVTAERNKLSYSLHNLKANQGNARKIVQFYKGKTLFGRKIVDFEETTELTMPTHTSSNCEEGSGRPFTIKIATDQNAHYFDLEVGCGN
jgi:hypothetical protein